MYICAPHAKTLLQQDTKKQKQIGCSVVHWRSRLCSPPPTPPQIQSLQTRRYDGITQPSAGARSKKSSSSTHTSLKIETRRTRMRNTSTAKTANASYRSWPRKAQQPNNPHPSPTPEPRRRFLSDRSVKQKIKKKERHMRM